MTALWHIFHQILREQPAAFWRGALLSLLVLVMGAALLGLSGWFITAAAAAGLAGVGAVFDVFRPSATVRFLALGRAAARYGERVLTHDATLRALETLRLRVLGGLIAAPYARMIHIRGAQALNRLTADIDALDGVPLRLVLPIVSGILTHVLVLALLWSLAGWQIAFWIFLTYVAGAALVFWQTTRKTARLSRQAEAAAQAFRSRFIDLIRARRDLAVQGRLGVQLDHVLDADTRRLDIQLRQDRAARFAGAALQIVAALVAGGALWIGVHLVQAGTLTPPFAALGLFAALALAETVMPLRRAASDLGRMNEAARRVQRDIARPMPPEAGTVSVPRSANLQVSNVTLHKPESDIAIVRDLSFDLTGGETIALTGASGSGKSTLLLAVAALHPIAKGKITLGEYPIDQWGEADLRSKVALLPQRSVLMNGSVADALRLASPDCTDAQMWDVLEAVQLAPLLHTRDGLETMIASRGEGFSGGEARRLMLARVLLRNPKVLLLDEPTEGLDNATAFAVLQGVRRYLPRSAILIAAHRPVEINFADRSISFI